MSVQLMSGVFERGPANPHLRLLLLALADHADDEGVAWPGVERLAAKCAVSARQIQRSLQQLEAEGWLVVDRGRGRGNTNLYRLEVERLLGKGDADVGATREGKGDTEGRKGDVRDGERVTSASPEPSVPNLQEPSISRPPISGEPARLTDVNAVAKWLSQLHPELAANARTAPPAAEAMAERISPESARRLIEAAGHQTDRAAVVAHVLPGVIKNEVERRLKARELRRGQADAAAARRAPGPDVSWPEHLDGHPISAKLAWLASPDGAAWAGGREALS